MVRTVIFTLVITLLFTVVCNSVHYKDLIEMIPYFEQYYQQHISRYDCNETCYVVDFPRYLIF